MKILFRIILPDQFRDDEGIFSYAISIKFPAFNYKFALFKVDIPPGSSKGCKPGFFYLVCITSGTGATKLQDFPVPGLKKT